MLSGTCLLCTQNLAVSGANQVLLNIVAGGYWDGNIVLLSPAEGPFAAKFADLGVAVKIGSLSWLLRRIPDVKHAICNTVMTAHCVVGLAERKIPHMWVLHEWWSRAMIPDELAKRNVTFMTPATVEQALDVCTHTVCVCNKQIELFKPRGPASAIFVGTPDAEPKTYASDELAAPADNRGEAARA